MYKATHKQTMFAYIHTKTTKTKKSSIIFVSNPPFFYIYLAISLEMLYYTDSLYIFKDES